MKNINQPTSLSKKSKIDTHPTAKAWAEITPLFVKYLQDRGYLKD